MTAKVNQGDTVTLEVLGKLENGTVFLDTKNEEAFKFVVGSENIISGLNAAVIGMGVNEEKSFLLNPSEAFGDYDDSLLVGIELGKLPPDVQTGMQLSSADEAGVETVWTVTQIDEQGQQAVLDGNHILAGQKLDFNIKVLEINPA